MASWFTRALDTITPWDRGGEVQRRQERKKREEEELRGRNIRSTAPRVSVSQPQSNQRVSVDGNDFEPKVNRPKNIFEDLNKNLNLNRPRNTVEVIKNAAEEPSSVPDPGEIVKPQQSFFNKIRDQFDANTEADRYRRTVDNARRIETGMVSRGVEPRDAKRQAITIAKNQKDVPSYRGVDVARDTAKGVAYDFIGKPLKTVLGTPIEASRSLIADVTGNEEAKAAADRRINENLFRKEGADKIDSSDEKLGWLDLLGSAGDAISVLPIFKGAQLAGRGIKTGVASRSIRPVLSDALAGLDEATIGLRNFFRPKPSTPVAVPDPVPVSTTPTPIPVRDAIPIQSVDGPPQVVNVRNLNEPKPLIREFPQDEALATPDALVQRNVREAREAAAQEVNSRARPDQSIEGVAPREPEAPFSIDATVTKTSQDKLIDEYAAFLREIGEGNGTQLIKNSDGSYYRISNNARFGDTKGKRMTKAMWRDEAERQLRAGQAEDGIQRAFNDAENPDVQSLLDKGEQPPAETPGRPINVKEVKSIPVEDKTVVPTDLPETPGRVRVTEANAPVNNKSVQVAESTPAVKTPSLPKEVQEVLDNPKKFTKRQVAAARNQRKLARQMAKTQEETADAISRIDNATPTTRSADEGFAPTGQFDKGKSGNVYEKASLEAEGARAAKANAGTPADGLIKEMSNKVEFNQSDISRINDMRERLMKDSNFRSNPAFKVLDEFYKQAGTQKGQGLALFNRYMRRTASGDQLTNKWYTKTSKVVDTSKISDADFEAVSNANNKFTKLRDAEVRLEEKYLQTGSEADFNAWQRAYKEAEKADLDAKTTELNVVKRASKGSKDENVAKVISDMEREADLNMMDSVTASQLSGPATGFRNLVGTELAGVENRILANTRAAITNKLFKSNVGGYSRKSARIGRKEGAAKFADDISRRTAYSGWNPIKHAQNWATSVNSLGDSSLYSQARSRLGKYYERALKEQGYSGPDLDRRVTHAIAKDPDNMADTFFDASMKSSGLSGLYQKTQKIEKSIADWIASGLDRALPPKVANSLAKGVTRLTVGYPTATANFVGQSAKRAALGVPSFLETGYKLARGDKQAAAMAFDRALKEAGSGAAMWGAGMALNQAGLVSGFYPEDEDERRRWKDEGISELSVKIGDAWYPIPTQFGMLGLPLLFGATYNEGGPEGVAETFTNPKNLSKLLPADQAYGTLQTLAGDSTENQEKNFVASAIRSLIPAGSFFAQTAKGLDQTANDTTTKDFWSNVFDQVATGIPGLNEASNIPDKTSSTGEPIQNPNLLQTYTGARSVEQEAGVRNTEETNDRINEALKGIEQYGLLSDPNMEGVLEGSALEAYTKASSGKQLDDSDIKALRSGLVKGVELSGTDTAYLEREQYDTNLAVLKLKKDIAMEDPTTKPSSLEKLDVAIKRGEVYKENKIPYDMIESYQDTSLTEWRKMGDKESDEYDPDMYQKLWEIDELMTNAGVSYKSGSLDKQKFSAKKTGSGRGRGGSRKLGSDFGKLKSGTFGPQVKQYESISTQTGGVPRIGVVRPNIVHKISASR